MGVYNEICFRQRILWEVVVQDNHSVSGRFGGADGLYGGYTVVNGDNERICYALNQRLRDTVPIGKAFWNDGLCTHAKMAEQLDQNGGGGDSIGVVISHNDNRHALRYRTGPDTFCCLWDVLNSIGFYVGRREQFLFCQAGHLLNGFQDRMIGSPFFPLLHIRSLILYLCYFDGANYTIQWERRSNPGRVAMFLSNCAEGLVRNIKFVIQYIIILS